MNWLGMSYGTTLGSLYAERFPYNIRSMVLDGAIAAPVLASSYFIESAVGSETAFKAALRWCERGANWSDPNCPAVPASLRGQSLEQLWNAMITRAERQPIRCSDPACAHADITASEIRSAATGHMYLGSTWWRIAAAIYNTTLQNDTASWVSGTATIANTNDPLSNQGYTNSYKFANRAVICQDEVYGYAGPADLKRLDVAALNVSPLVRGTSPASSFQTLCIGWPGNVRFHPHAVDIPRTEKLPKILMSQVIYDGATPLSVGMRLRDDIGDDRVVTILRDGGGHGSYQVSNASTSEAVAAISAYLFNLTLPEDATIFSS